MFVYYLYDSCYLFCSVSREAGHICLFSEFTHRRQALLAYGHAALSLIVMTAGDACTCLLSWILRMMYAVRIGNDLQSTKGKKDSKKKTNYEFHSCIIFLFLRCFITFLSFKYHVTIPCAIIHTAATQSPIQNDLLPWVICLWWKPSGYVDMDLQDHVASSGVHLPPNLKMLAGSAHLSMALSSRHIPLPIFHWDMTMTPMAGSVNTLWQSQNQPPLQ